jgi:hypothetical protein
MINLKLSAAAAVLAMGLSAQAGATVIPLDGFEGVGQDVFQASPTSTVGNRTLSIYNVIQGGSSPVSVMDPYASISTGMDANGTLQIANGSFDDSDVDLTYAINDAEWANLTSLKLNFLGNDNAVPTSSSVTLMIGADTIGTIFLPDQNTPFQIAFDINGVISDQFAAGTTDITFTFSGSPEFDMTLDSIAANVPEPGMIGLFGLGLAGIGLASRRRRKA